MVDPPEESLECGFGELNSNEAWFTQHATYTKKGRLFFHVIHTPGLIGILELFSTNCSYLDSTAEGTDDRLDNKLISHCWFFNGFPCRSD